MSTAKDGSAGFCSSDAYEVPKESWLVGDGLILHFTVQLPYKGKMHR